jgi:hypothetical protein
MTVHAAESAPMTAAPTFVLPTPARRGRSWALWALAALGLALLASALPPTTLAASENPLLVIVDQSGSMRTNDPRRYTVDGVQLAVATLRTGKEMEVIGFSDDASVLLPWNSFPTMADRAAARDLLNAKLQFDGAATRYLKALDLGWRELYLKHAPAGTRVIFFTDGNPDDDPAKILDQTAHFAEQGWIIDTVRLVGPGDNTGPTLAAMSTQTRGSHADISDAKQLVEHFIAEANEENDYFLLNLRQWRADVPVVVPPGTERFCLLDVKTGQYRHRGDFTAFSRDSNPVAIDDATAYRYPRADLADAHSTNLDCVELFSPPTGSYTATFDGDPGSVYISLALGARVQLLPIPAAVDEGAVITPGVALVIPGADPAVLADIAKSVTVSATITDGGAALFTADLPAQIHDGRVIYDQDWPAILPDAADRAHDHYLAVTYHVIDQATYHLDKHDAFTVHPHAGGPPPKPQAKPEAKPEPKATWGQPTVNLGPCWNDQGAGGTLPVTTSGPAGSLTFPGGDGFTFPSPLATPGTTSLPYAFKHPQGGRHHGAFAATETPAVTTPDLSIDNYPWAGRDALALTGPGPTGIPDFSPGADGLAAQPLQPFTVTLASPAGATVAVAVDAAGVATLSPALDNLPPAVFTGTTGLAFGNLPVRQLALTLRRDRPATVMKWGEGKLQADEKLDPSETRMEGGDGPIRIKEPRAGVWKPAGWLEAQVPMALASGMAGTWKVVLGDLTGPEGETLTAAYDVRAVIDQPHLAAGDATTLHVRVIRPRKMPPGDYSGQATIVFTPDQGDPERFQRPVVVTLP